MIEPRIDNVFAGSVPKLYEEYLVPLVFAPYAPDMVKRLEGHPISRPLEIAAGTGVVTRELAETLPPNVEIIATDLNQGMIDHAQSIGTKRPVKWEQADAMALPFADGSFDAVVCQFGVMFFPDKAKAFAEVRRVLRPGGLFIFNVWDRIEENDFPHIVTTAIASLFPDDPPRFHARVPHGYHSQEQIERDLVAGGFKNKPEIETVVKESRAKAPRVPAMAYCQGTPLRNEIEERDEMLLSDATARAARALAERFGNSNIVGKIQALVVTVTK
jgi:ubiquinone/menaquinone biosynthesis C-methylase UbiE